MATKKTNVDPESSKETKKTTRLYRSEANRVIGGVAAGIGEYANVDPTIIRLAFVLFGVFGGSGLLLYLVLWIIIPTKSSVNATTDQIQENITEIKGRTKNLVASMRVEDGNKNRHLGSIILIALGAVFVLKNFGVYDIDLGRLWPFLLIVLGLLLLRRR